jgi:hypothetical protein
MNKITRLQQAKESLKLHLRKVCLQEEDDLFYQIGGYIYEIETEEELPLNLVAENWSRLTDNSIFVYYPSHDGGGDAYHILSPTKHVLNSIIAQYGNV